MKALQLLTRGLARQVEETLSAAHQAIVDEGWLETVAEHRDLLLAFAEGRGRQLRFPAVLESRFQRFCRERAWLSRLSTTIITALLWLTAPLWTETQMDLPAETFALTRMLDFQVLVPLFIAVTLLLFWKPASTWTEWAYIVAFVVEAAVIECFRVKADEYSFYLSPALTIAVPISVIAIGRLPFFRSLGLIVAVVSMQWLFRIFEPLPASWPHQQTVLLAAAILLCSSLLAAGFAQRSVRQMWALLQLAQIGASIDFLTNLPNRSAFERHLERSLRSAAREKQVSVIALVDLDHFKFVNDRYGHPYGDRVLQQVARCIGEFARRPADIAARFGGEEFALFLCNCNLQSAISE